jgi:ubiquinone/menaquinone biosynthesis C-methylase UbiE
MARGLEQIPWLYDLMFWVYEHTTPIGPWRKALVGGARGRVLDVGCGTGRNLPLYAPGLSVVGVDIDADSLAAAKRRSPGTPLVRASVQALPFRDGAFDTAVSGLVFCSVSAPEVGLSELKRVLTDDGELRMLEHVRSTSRMGAWLQDRLQPLWTRVSGGCHPNRETERTVAQSGFRIQEDRQAQAVLRRFTARKS